MMWTLGSIAPFAPSGFVHALFRELSLEHTSRVGSNAKTSLDPKQCLEWKQYIQAALPFFWENNTSTQNRAASVTAMKCLVCRIKDHKKNDASLTRGLT